MRGGRWGVLVGLWPSSQEDEEVEQVVRLTLLAFLSRDGSCSVVVRNNFLGAQRLRRFLEKPFPVSTFSFRDELMCPLSFPRRCQGLPLDPRVLAFRKVFVEVSNAAWKSAREGARVFFSESLTMERKVRSVHEADENSDDSIIVFDSIAGENPSSIAKCLTYIASSRYSEK